ncbi:AraC family transcriptional regulator [Aestuariicella hydrocarbonica]|uniref:AraC family transcriptional regulator n=1 Tax=Pseudomaricurvus hydrocarbonicus TaxID=1470433 RepID=A0A9E5JVR0_9GAMM|nr:AraC family transcriptional regulator [Aestuariicella hydrocarbonica]NHO66376.1 AraC family transcriptional regulator [Aestuariicella hydrocarbonica]
MYLVRSGAVDGIEKLIHDMGANPIELIQSLGLRQSQFRNPNTYIAYHKVAELMELCSDRCNSPLFGLQLAQRQNSNVLGDLPVLVSRAVTVGEALSSANQYLYLHASGVRMETEPQGDLVRLALALNLHSPRGIHQLIQMSVGHLVTFVADMLNSDRFAFTLHFMQPAPETLSTAQQSLFQNIKFGQAFNGLLIPKNKLDTKNHQDQTALNKHFLEYLHHLQNRYPDNLENQIQDIIGRLLPSGDCTVEQVAASLGMHPRTLQTKLKQQGTSYREILQDTRQGLAEQHLRYRSVNITDLALQLGYSEVAVFSRHFKRWLGVSPREWQKAQRKEQEAEDDNLNGRTETGPYDKAPDHE